MALTLRRFDSRPWGNPKDWHNDTEGAIDAAPLDLIQTVSDPIGGRYHYHARRGSIPASVPADLRDRQGNTLTLHE
jgi:hypothetical protein